MSRSGARPSLTTIAADLGVSAKTVSNAFRQPGQLSPALREKILAHAAVVGYAGPDPLARAFREQASRLIGVVYPNQLSHAFADGAFVAFLSGVAEVLEEARFALTLIPAGKQGEPRPVAVRDAVMDAAIVYSIALEDEALAELRSRRLPFVTVDGPRLDGVPWVGIDDRGGMRLIAGHVRDLGHTRIGIVSFAINLEAHGEIVMLDDLPPSTLEMTSARLAGIADVLGDLDQDVPVVHCYGSAEDVGQAGARALYEWYPDLTAWLFLADRMAVGGMTVATKAGMTIPGDLSITGFDDAAPGSGLTTVRQPHREKGVTAARHLLDIMAGREVPGRTELPVEMIVRSSSGPPTDSPEPRPRR